MPEEATPTIDEAENQDTPQPSKRQVRVRINDRDAKTVYVNAFRSNASVDEVILDLGLNVTVPTGGAGEDEGVSSEVRFDITDRVVMNFYTAKRMALLLGNLVRQHEQQFGELKLNAADRIVQPPQN